MHLALLLLTCAGIVAAFPDDNQIMEDYGLEPYHGDDKDKKHFKDDSPYCNRDEVVTEYETVNCYNVMDKMEEVKDDSMCNDPVDVFVNTSEDSTYKYAPTRVKVKRCGGMCMSKQSCMATTSEMVKIPVTRIRLSDDQRDCAYAIVKQDINCMCGCVTKEEDCRGKEMYDKNACACVCEDMEKKKGRCLHQRDREWRSENCDCACKAVIKCSAGKKWDDDKCECVRKGSRPLPSRPRWRS